VSATAPTTYTTDSGGDVSIVINGTTKIAGWQSVEINRSVEVMPNHFTLTMTEEFSDDPTKILALPGSKCAVSIGPDLVVTGYIDRYDAAISPTQHEVRIIGRGLCQDLVDCSADLLSPSGPLSNGAAQVHNALQLATILCEPFGITARCPFPPDPGPILVFQVQLGETPYDIIERVARYQGYLVYEDETGQLVLDRAPSYKTTQSMHSGFAEGVNVEAAASSLAMDQRFSTITVVWSTVDLLTEGTTPNVFNNRGQSVDIALAPASTIIRALPTSIMNVYESSVALKPGEGSAVDAGLATIKRYRPRIIQSSQTDGTQDYGQRMADWEMARRIGRSESVHITCDSWRDDHGKLWTPNWYAVVNIPKLKMVNANWVIVSVTFRKDQTGTHADLNLMPERALSIQPSILLPYDVEVTNSVRRSQDPAPPTSTTGLKGRN